MGEVQMASIWAVVILALGVVASMTIVEVMRPDIDHAQFIGSLIGSIAPTAAAIVAVAKSLENGAKIKDVNQNLADNTCTTNAIASKVDAK